MKYKYNIKNLDCANCAKKIEEKLNKDKNIKNAIVNFSASTVSVETDLEKSFEYVKQIVSEVEPDAILSEEKVKEDNYKIFYQILVGGILGLIGCITKLPYHLNLIIIIISYIVLVYSTFITAIKQLSKKIINENLLIVISTIGAFVLGELHEGLMVIFLYELGKSLEKLAVNRSRKSVSELMNIKEENSNLKEEDTIKVVPTETIKVGDIIVVKEGEKVPLDGIIIEGNAMLDTSALTGESELLNATIGSEVLSGSINKSGLIEVKVTSVYKNSTVSRILSLVETATERKTKTETVVSKYAPIYTLSVLIVAILVGALLPLITNLTYTESIYKALTIIVVSCPCAVAISVPLAYFSGIGASSKEGILIKGSNYLDSIKNIQKVVFDKTGTITTGQFYVSKINIYDKKYTKDKVLELCAKGESLSNHPIAASIIKEYGKEVSTEDIKEHREYQGKGITYNYKDQNIKIGNSKFCNQKETKNIYLMINDNLVAELEIKDEIKESAKETIKVLKDMNIETYMFTGDNKEKALEIAKKVGIKNIFYEMLPNEKYQKLEELINTKKEKELVSFVGDGINDAPVLALSDIGISMGSLGSDSAIEASDVVIMNDNLSKIITAIKISQKTNKIIKENLIFAITIKLLVLILTILGLSTMWEAVFADVGVTVLCILNTLRLLKNNQL